MVGRRNSSQRAVAHGHRSLSDRAARLQLAGHGGPAAHRLTRLRASLILHANPRHPAPDAATHAMTGRRRRRHGHSRPRDLAQDQEEDSAMAATDPNTNAREVSRRGFLSLCTLASGGLVTGRRSRGATGVGPAAGRQGGGRGAEEGRHAARRLLHRGRHHGPAPVGQQDRPADLPQHLRAAGGAGRQARHQARPGRVLAAARSEDAHLQAAPGREVPRRHRLQRRGGQVQLQPDEDRAQVGAQGRGGQHRHGGRRRRVHRQAQPEAARRGAARHPHRPRRA